MEITNATSQNLEDIVRLNKQFHLDIPNFKWDTPMWINEELQKGNYFILGEKEQVFGAICLESRDDGVHIETIAVRSELHRKGLGKKMICYAIDRTKKEGQRKLIVESFLDYGLEGFYLKSGFLKSVLPRVYSGKKYNQYFMFVA
jgi:ribosomal protein S18 acetylase RimI-like enzyme